MGLFNSLSFYAKPTHCQGKTTSLFFVQVRMNLYNFIT